MYRSGLLARAFSAVPESSYILGQAKLQNIRSQQSSAHRPAIPSSTHFFHTSTCTRQLSQLAPTQQLLSKGELTQRQRPKPSHAPRYTNYFDEEVIWPDKLFPSEYSRPTLSEEQNRVLKKVVENKESVFFTGSAGTGKSVLLRAIIEALGGPSDEVVVTASTGIAAVNIGGQTLHSFAGAGLGNAPIEKLVQRVRWTAEARWRKAKTLIIDEVSMVDATWFDCLEEIARKIRKNRKPFGGLQLVICGDFFQLPPVPNREVTDAPASFVFDSWSWDKCIQTSITLTEVFRQKDPKLVKILNDARIGVVSDESAQILRSLARPVEYADGIGPTEIYPLRSQADHANRRRLMELPGESYSFDAEDWLGVDEDKERLSVERASDLLNRMVVPKRLKLKVGANVMCLRNVQGIGIVNGSTGRVIGFMRPRDFKVAMRRRSQWAVISSFEPDPEKRAFGPARYENSEWPVVEFPDGMRALLGPVAFTVENKKEMIEVKRVQVPLILSWALTVHKSQGQTLDRVKIDLERTFEKGQAYVALSRCTSLEGLEVYNFSKTAIVAHPRVQRWSKQLISLNPYVKKPVRKGRTSVG